MTRRNKQFDAITTKGILGDKYFIAPQTVIKVSNFRTSLSGNIVPFENAVCCDIVGEAVLDDCDEKTIRTVHDCCNIKQSGIELIDLSLETEETAAERAETIEAARLAYFRK